MSSSPSLANIAQHRASEVDAARQRLDAGRERLDRYRAQELAESEALVLARMKADNERLLARQAETLRDAERALELKAIERRAADLEALKESQRRMALEQEAQGVAAARRDADLLAAATADERIAARAAALAARQARLLTQREALRARRHRLLSRIRLAGIAMRGASPLVAAAVAVVLGAAGGWLHARHGDTTGAPLVADAAADTPALKFVTELSSPR